MRSYVTTNVAALAMALSIAPVLADPVGTAFTYQGQLKQGGVPVGQTCDFEFRLFDAEATPSGIQVGATLTFDGVGMNPSPIAVVDGLFTVALDFGSNAFNGDARWLQIDVCCASPCAPGFTTLSPRQPITATPYALPTRGLFVNDAGNVGIGTPTPQHTLHVDGSGVRTIFGRNTATSGFTTGVRGESTSTDGTGVFGFAPASSGSTFGVFGETASTAGRGVFGKASALSGSAEGVLGESVSTSGIGVFGIAPALSGSTIGVRGESLSPDGRGMSGLAPALSGGSSGVVGETGSPAGFGVFSFGNFGGTGAKFFIQPHPTDASKEIRFVSLEGNESGTTSAGRRN